MAVPSILIVAPNGTVNEATLSFTSRFFLRQLNVIGIVALLLDVENEKIRASLRPEKNLSIFMFP